MRPGTATGRPGTGSTGSSAAFRPGRRAGAHGVRRARPRSRRGRQVPRRARPRRRIERVRIEMDGHEMAMRLIAENVPAQCNLVVAVREAGDVVDMEQRVERTVEHESVVAGTASQF